MEKNYPLLIKKFTSFFCVIDVTKIILGITEAIKREKKIERVLDKRIFKIYNLQFYYLFNLLYCTLIKCN